MLSIRWRMEKAKQLSQEDWLGAARVVMSEQGVEAVKVEVLSRHLKVSKGSFYWHFKNRDDLLGGLLELWASSTDWLIAEANKESSPADKLKLLFQLIAELGISGESSIHVWAKQDVLVAEKLKEVERKRLAFLETLFKDAGFRKRQAKENAELCYLAFLGYAFKAGQASVFDLELNVLGNKLSELFIQKES